MELELSEERRLLRESAERFVRERYDFAQRRPIAESATRFSATVWRDLAQMGWLALPLPEAHGGFGGGAIDTGLILEAFGRGLVLEPYVSTVILGAGLIAAQGDAAQCAQWLPAVGEGRLRLALAHGESMSRALGQRPATRAQRVAEGWRLQGQKCLVFDAPGADLLLVSAVCEDGVVGLFAVPAGRAGLSLRAYETVDARRAADLSLESVVVPLENRLESGGPVAESIEAALDAAGIALCAEAVGAMQVLLDDTVAYTKTRVQFERPLASNQVLKHRMVDMAIHLEEARAMAWRASLHATAAPAVRQREVSAARLRVSRAARFVSENAVQLHGAMGVTEELNVGAYFKRLLAIDRSFGTPTEHHARLSALRTAQAA